eukprot:6514131-Karenia_brevis.AAC.1
MAQSHARDFATATAPAQVALGTRAGIDLALLVARFALESNDDLVLLSVDGIGAYDHMSRRAMLTRLDQLAEARSLLPFLLQFYGQRSTYLVYNEAENRMRDLLQGEGGEQGDPLMPALFSL